MSYPRTASIYINDPAGAQIFHAYQVNYGPEWHVNRPGWSSIIIASGEGDLGRYIAGAIHKLGIGWSFHAQWYIEGEAGERLHSKVYDCWPDEMGGVVSGGMYLGWSEWIREAIPKTSALQLVSETIP